MQRILPLLLLINVIMMPAQPTSQEEQPKIKIVPRIITTSKPELQRGPNDRISIDSNGDLVAEGATLPNGQPFTFRIGRRVHIDPQITSTLHSNPESIEYIYSLTNRSDSQQWIQLFWMDTHGPVQETRIPQYWRVYNIRPISPQINRVYIGRFASDDDVRGRLMAGESTGPFSLRSAWRPGLVKIQAVGHQDPPTPGPNEEAYERFSGNMSEWLREAIRNELTNDKNSVTIYTIGPRVSPETPGLEAVQSQLQEGARLSVFTQQDRKQMLALASADSVIALRNGLLELNSKTSGLTAEFYSALLTYLR